MAFKRIISQKGEISLHPSFRVQSCQMTKNIVPNLSTDSEFSNIELSKVRNAPELIPTV